MSLIENKSAKRRPIRQKFVSGNAAASRFHQQGKPDQPYFVAVTLALLASGFWHVYARTKPECADGSFCALPQSTIITQSVLWVATIIVLAAMTLQWWAPLFY